VFGRLIAALIAACVLVSVGVAEGYAPNMVLVKFRSGSVGAGLLHVGALGAVPIQRVPALGVEVFLIPSNVPVEQAVRQYSGLPSVEYAEPNYIYERMVVPNDQHYGVQWALPKISAPSAWDITTGSTTVKVAVLDTGYDTTHPDLYPQVVSSKDFTILDGSPDTVQDGHGHGTHVAGTVAALTNNSIGVAAIGWNTKLMIGKVLGNNGSGYLSEIANGITWAADNGAKVINMSLGGSSGSTTLQNAVNYAWNKGVVLVAAAGNAGNTRQTYPAAYTNCIAVAATTSNDSRASFSTYGSWVDCAAPGVDIASTYKGSAYAYMSGTSMAAPHVAGLAGLVWATSHGTSNTNVRSRIETTGDPVSSGFRNSPTRRINALKAVQ